MASKPAPPKPSPKNMDGAKIRDIGTAVHQMGPSAPKGV